MEMTSNKQLLPTEILTNIFKHSTPKDCREYHLVGKAWYHPAHAFVAGNIKLHFKPGDCKELCQDLIRFPQLADRADYLVVQQREHADSCADYKSITDLCRNLTTIHLEEFHIDTLKEFERDDIKLDHIQQIKFGNILFNHQPQTTLNQYALTSFRFRRSLTHLELFGFSKSSLFQQYNNNFEEFISQFQSLTHIKINYDRDQRATPPSDLIGNVNISSLLKAAKHLQEVEIYGIDRLFCDNDDDDLTYFQNLINLGLKALEMDIDSLQTIMDKFRNGTGLNSFCIWLTTSLLTNDVPVARQTEIMDNFREFYNSARSASIRLSLDNQMIVAETGIAQPRSIIFNRLNDNWGEDEVPIQEFDIRQWGMENFDDEEDGFFIEEDDEELRMLHELDDMDINSTNDEFYNDDDLQLDDDEYPFEEEDFDEEEYLSALIFYEQVQQCFDDDIPVEDDLDGIVYGGPEEYPEFNEGEYQDAPQVDIDEYPEDEENPWFAYGEPPEDDYDDYPPEDDAYPPGLDEYPHEDEHDYNDYDPEEARGIDDYPFVDEPDFDDNPFDNEAPDFDDHSYGDEPPFEDDDFFWSA